jgi:nucleotide-binding universal stress UspA family protein
MKTLEIKKILVPTDFSQTSMNIIEHAAFMAKLCKADLYLLHVVEPVEYAYSEYQPEIMVKDVRGVEHMTTKRLERIAGMIRNEYEINTIYITKNGRLAPGVVRTAKQHKIDLIIMGIHGVTGIEEYIADNYVQKIIETSPCPVITLPSDATTVGFSNIVVPIDNSLHSRQKVNDVIEVAKQYHSIIHVLGFLDGNEEVAERDLSIKLETVENAIKHAGLHFVKKIVTGHNIASEAIKYSEEVKADLLAVMTNHESILSGILWAKMAKQVINHSKVPIMSIKPEEHYETFQEIW